jgi:uncharacterized protein YjbI with pentapeptide repeats
MDELNQVTIRGTSSELPFLPNEMELIKVSSLDSRDGSTSEFDFGGIDTPALEIKDVRLFDGRIHSVRAEASSIQGAHVRSVEFAQCELNSLHWANGRISRTRFNSCKLLGARFHNVSLDHVVFSDCKMEYSTFDQLRASGPIIFLRCSFRESEFNRCDLTGALFDRCDLALTSFRSGRYAQCDLRGNKLSLITGAQHLRHVIIDRMQLIDLAEALAVELDVTFGDDTAALWQLVDPIVLRCEPDRDGVGYLRLPGPPEKRSQKHDHRNRQRDNGQRTVDVT